MFPILPLALMGMLGAGGYMLYKQKENEKDRQLQRDLAAKNNNQNSSESDNKKNVYNYYGMDDSTTGNTLFNTQKRKRVFQDGTTGSMNTTIANRIS